MTGSGFTTSSPDRSPWCLTFGTTQVAATWVDTTHLTAATPAHAAGVVNVIVTDKCGGSGSTATLTNGFTYFGAAAKLAFAQQPSNTVAGTAISPAVTVQVLDSNNTLVTNSTASVSMAIGNNPAAGTLSGTTPKNAVNGVATFSDLSINNVGTGYTLAASGGVLTGATSNAFNIITPPFTASWNESTLTLTGNANSSLIPNRCYQIQFVDPDLNSSFSASHTGPTPFSENKVLTAPYRVGTWTISLLEGPGSGACSGFSTKSTTTVNVTASNRKLALTTIPAATAVGQESGQWTVTRQNGNGNAYIDGSSLTVNLDSSSTTDQFRAVSAGPGVASVSIGAASSNATFFYFDTTAGVYTVTASATNHANGTTSYTVNAANTTTGNVGNASGTYGQAATVALSATVTANSPSSAVVNEGTVTFAIKQGMTPVATVTSGTVAGGAASANLSLSGIGAGTYSIGATYNPAVSNPNFDTSTSATPGSLTIGQASSTTTVTGGSFVYDGSAHAATVSVTGAGGLSLTPAPGYSGSCSTAPTTVGQGTSCTASYTYAGDANHTGSNGSATVTITQAQVKVQVGSDSPTYDGTSKTVSLTVTPPASSSVVVLTYTSASPSYNSTTGPTNAGTYAATASLTDAANYAFTGDSVNPGSLTIGQASSTTTVTGGSFVYDGSAHAATVSVTGAGGLSLTPAPGYSGSCSTAPTTVGQGTSCTASYTYAGDANHTGSNGSATVTITQASTTTLAIVSGSIVRFKDLVTLSAKVTPANMGSALTGSVAFKIGSGSYGSANVVPIPGDLTGAVQASVIVQESEMPGPYTVTVTFTSTNASYSGSVGTTGLTVIPRTASPYNATGFYTGDLFAWTTGESSNTATLTMTAMIKDTNVPGGDVRAANVTFYFVNGTTLTPIGSAKNLPVGLVDVTNGSVGTASAIVQLNISSANAQSFQIAVGITGGYTNNPFDALSENVVTVAKPIPGGFIVGGGELVNTAATTGLIKGAVGQPTDFSFNVQYNKSQTNPQGKAFFTIRSYYKSNGTLDSSLHTYIVSTSAIALLAVTVPTASFSSKANVDELLSNGTVVSVEGGATLLMSMNGVTNTLAITVQRKAGGLWYSSNFNSATGKTVEQAISAGDVSVN